MAAPCQGVTSTDSANDSSWAPMAATSQSPILQRRDCRSRVAEVGFPRFRQSRDSCAAGSHVRLTDGRTSRALARTRDVTTAAASPSWKCLQRVVVQAGQQAPPHRHRRPKESSRAARPHERFATGARAAWPDRLDCRRLLNCARATTASRRRTIGSSLGRSSPQDDRRSGLGCA